MPAIIGNRPNEFMAAFKIRWLFDEQAEQYGRTHVIHFSPKDYVIYRLTGRHVTDPTTATTVGLMNLASRCWDSASLRQFGISEKLLPTIEPSRAVIGRIGDVAARQLGLAAGVPVVNGLGDAGASTVGAGMTEVGQAYIHLGTTAWVAGMSDLAAAPLPRRTFALPHAEPGKLIEIAPTLSGGDCIAWLRGVLGIEIDALSAPIAAVDARPSDVMFLPYLNGERSPFVDASVRGGFVMLGRSDGAAEMLYAVLEGVAFSLRENMDLLDVKTDTVRLIGGGGGSDVWPQLIADAVGRVVEVADKSNIVPAFGAYCEAVRAFDGVPGELRFGRRFLPRPERLERNGRRHNLFRSATAFVRTLPRQ
jgi:xylulokinase